MLNSKTTLFIVVSVATMLFSGCSGKQYFEPKETSSAKSHSYGSSIIDVSRDGATLKNGKYIGKYGINNLSLGKGFRFLNENQRYILASNTEGVLNIIDKNTKDSMRAVSLHVPIVSATIQNGLVAYVLNNNTFGLYQIEGNRKLIQNRSERSYAIDTKAANPIFIDNLVVMPMLDGKLVIVDTRNSDNTKVVYVSSNKFFNNIIYLSRIGNTMIAATPKRVITLGENGKQEYNANISEVASANSSIYLFTKEGEIVKLNNSLQEIVKKKFKFAHFSTGTAFGDKVFGLDHQGSLLVLSSDLSKFKIYDVGSVDNAAFIIGSKLYKDSKVIELSTLGYE